MGSEKSQSGGLQADSTLATLLRNLLALPHADECVSLPDGRLATSCPDVALYAGAVIRRARELGGDTDRHIDRALQAIGRGDLR